MNRFRSLFRIDSFQDDDSLNLRSFVEGDYIRFRILNELLRKNRRFKIYEQGGRREGGSSGQSDLIFSTYIITVCS